MAAKAYRLLRSILMTAVTSERPTRSAAQAALWAMGKNGRADYDHDRRYRALMLLATLSWAWTRGAGDENRTRTISLGS